jgi:hypothetical protein
MLQVGLIGLGPEWQLRFRPALTALRHRLQVRGIYTTVASQAEHAAVELKCDAAPGLVALAERDDVKALLVLDTDWHMHVPAWVACRLSKPAFLAGRLAMRFCRPDLRKHSAESGVTLMPGLAHRYTPATSRLRELIATKLGRPLSLEIVTAAQSLEGEAAKALAPSSQREALAMAIDWCTCVVGTAPISIVPGNPADRAEADRAAKRLEMEFRRPTAGGEAARAKIDIDAEFVEQPVSMNLVQNTPIIQRARIVCLRGEAVLKPPIDIEWEAGGKRVTESLTADRREYEVMLDHFTRRVLGGLIPVPTLDDLYRAHVFASQDVG